MIYEVVLLFSTALLVHFLQPKNQKQIAIINLFTIFGYAVLFLAPNGIITSSKLHTSQITNLFHFSDNLVFVIKNDALSLAYEKIIFIAFSICQIYASISYVFYRSKETKEYRFFSSTAPLATGLSILLAKSGSLYSTLFAYELITIITSVMISIRRTHSSIEAARKYLSYLMITGIPLIVLCAVYGNFGIYDESQAIQRVILSPLPSAALTILFLMGCAKAAIIPFHYWLIYAMEAPAFISAMLHSALVVGAGIFVLCRSFMHLLPMENASSTYIIFIFGSISCFVSALHMLKTEIQIKQYIAWSTINGLSWIVASMGMNAIFGKFNYISVMSRDFSHFALPKIFAFLACDNYLYAEKKKTQSSISILLAAFAIVFVSYLPITHIGIVKIITCNNLFKSNIYIQALVGYTSVICSSVGAIYILYRLFQQLKTERKTFSNPKISIFLFSVLLIVALQSFY